jgi:uncharacterized membrane protein YagU involved in acid resistance
MAGQWLKSRHARCCYWPPLESRGGSMLEQAIQGGLAGLVATGPMTAVMRAGERLVPITGKVADRGKLPPRQITERVLHEAGVRHEFDERERSAAATIAHYGFGTAAGGLLGLAASSLKATPRPVLGAAVGVAVWAASYAGWLPLTGMRRSASEEPAGRNVQMIAAHIVWGVAAGAALDVMSRKT